MIANLAITNRNTYHPAAAVQLPNSLAPAIALRLGNLVSDISQEANPNLLATLASEVIQHSLSAEASAKIAAFKDSSTPFLWIKGAITTTGLPPTPVDDTSPEETSWRVQAATMLGFLKLCDASARSFADEMGGRLFHMVMPAKNDLRSMLRSTKALNFHTEVVNGFFREESPSLGAPIAPEKFALGCLRNPQSVATTVLPLAEVLAKLGTETKRVLQQPLFVAKSQSSFDRDIVINNVPALVRLSSGALGVRYSTSKLAATCSVSAAALEELRQVIGSFDSSWSVVLEPGDILILNNRLCMHGRGEVGGSSKFNGEDRWLLRLYGYDDATLRFLKCGKQRSHVMSIDSPEYPHRQSA
jgi:hypothetical protein